MATYLTISRHQLALARIQSMCCFLSIRVLTLVLVIATANGCTSMTGFPDRSVTVKCEPGGAKIQTRDCELKILLEKYFAPTTNVLEKYDDLRDETDKKTEKKKRAYRDKVVYGRMLAFDLIFSRFQEEIYKENVGWNLNLDISGVLVGAGGAVVTNEKASRILSAVSGGISGSRTAINKNLYYEKTMPAILATMQANRKRIASTIYKSLQGNTGIYPLGRALIDLEDYFFVGSLPGAVALIADSAAQVSQQASVDIAEVRSASVTEAANVDRLDVISSLIRNLPDGAALELLRSPPIEFPDSVSTSITGRIGGRDIAEANLSDADAKQVLEMAILLHYDGTEEILKAWEAAVTSESERDSEEE